MKASKFFFSTLIAAAAMTANVYASTLDDAVLSIDSFTTENIGSLKDAGWTVSNITGTSSGTYTTTDSQGKIAEGESGKQLTTHRESGNRYLWSAVVTVDADVFVSGTTTDLLMGNLGLGVNGTSLVGRYATNTSEYGKIENVNAYKNSDGTVTLGLVFDGDGTRLYVLGANSVYNGSLKDSYETNEIKLSSSSDVSYSNLYCFNTALSASDMNVAMTEAGGYVWMGESSNVWNTSSENWTKAGDFSVFVSGASVLFDDRGANKTVKINESVTAGVVVVDDSYTFDVGKTGSLSATSIFVSNGSTLTKSGSGALTFNGTIEQGATLKVTEGEVTISSADRVFDGNLVVGKNATVTGTTTDSLSYDSGNQFVTVHGTLILNNLWTVAERNSITIAGGTISGTGQSSAGGVALDYYQSGTINATEQGSKLDAIVRVKGGTSLTFNVSENADLTVSKSMVLNYLGTATVIKDGLGDLTLSAANTGAANFDVKGGNLIISADNTLASLTTAENTSVSVSAGASLTVTGTTTLNVASLKVVSGEGAIVGWQNLQIENLSYKGASLSSSRDVSLETNGVISVGGNNLVWAGEDGNNTWNTESTNWVSQQDSSVKDSFHNMDSVSFSGSGSSKVVLASGGVVGVRTMEVTSGSYTLATGAGTTSSIVGETLTVVSGATLNVGDSDGNADATGIRAVQLGFDNIKLSGKISYNNGATTWSSLEFCGEGPLSDTTRHLKIEDTNGSGLTIGKTIVSNDAKITANWGGVVSLGAVTLNASLSLEGSNNTYKISSISGSGTLIQNGGTSTISGTATINTLNQNGGTLNISGTGTINTLNQNGGTLTVSGDLTTDYYQGVTIAGGETSAVVLSSGASWTNSGDFYLRHTGNYETTFTIAGKVSVGGNLYVSRDGKGTIEINDGGVLDVSALVFGQNWDGVGNKGSWVNVNEGGILVTDEISIGSNLNTSELKLNGGTLGTSSSTLTIDASTASGAGAGVLPLTLGTGTTSTINTSIYENNAFGRKGANISVVNVISGDGALKVDGAGVLTLSGNNTYSGGTTISAGTVVAAHKKALGTGSVSVADKAYLSLGTDVTVSGLSGEGSVILANGVKTATLTVDSSDDQVFAGSFGTEKDYDMDDEYAIGLVKTGTGTLTLTGSSYFSGGSVSVNKGTLYAAFSGALGQAEVAVADGASLKVSPTSEDWAVYASSVELAAGAQLLVDLGYLTMPISADENFALTVDVIAAATIKFGDTTLQEGNSIKLPEGYVSFVNSDAFSEYAKSWSYDGKVLSLTLAIPEPSMFGLLAGLGALALAGTRRRRK